MLLCGGGVITGLCLNGSDENVLSLCMEYFLENFLYEDIIREELLRYVLLHRSVLFFLGAVNGTNLMRSSTRWGLLGLVLFFVGYGWGILILRYQIKAVVFLVGMLTPQWYFYGCSLFFSEKMRKTFQNEETSEMCRNTVLYAIFFGVGVMTEVIINPIWMKFLIELL
ncbi:MAG: hypothetical protein E7277_00615 [Lachnospiraceae bacterium]|nr:hypothetical protein [Lachnospiraceae bacterium]